MGTLDTRNKIHHTIDALPPEKLDAILAFLDDLKRSGEDETAMLMSDPQFVEDYKQAKKDIRTGQTASFKAIRRDV